MTQFCQAQIGYTSVWYTEKLKLNKSRAGASSWTGSSSSDCPGWQRGRKGRCASGPTISPEPRCCCPAVGIYSGNALLVSTWNDRRIKTSWVLSAHTFHNACLSSITSEDASGKSAERDFHIQGIWKQCLRSLAHLTAFWDAQLWREKSYFQQTCI